MGPMGVIREYGAGVLGRSMLLGLAGSVVLTAWTLWAMDEDRKDAEMRERIWKCTIDAMCGTRG